MATITSVTNFTGSKQWSDTSAWQGGVVPVSGDLAQVRGIRTTVNRSGGYTYWTGSSTFVVASTSGFPSSGSFYTVTDRDQKVKIDYNGILNSTTFNNCTVDTSYFQWGTSSLSSGFDRVYGGTIGNSYYVLYQPIIEITGSVSTGEIRIENGGYLKIYGSGSLEFESNLTVRDGTLHVSESGEIKFGLNNTNASSGNTNRIYGENYQLSQIIFEGSENRLNTKLTQDVSIGDGKLYVENANNFEINDFIIVKDQNSTLLRVDDNWGGGGNYELKLTGSWDECFNVVGKSGSALLVSRMNSIDVPILETSSIDNKTIITDSTRLSLGEKVVINNEVYTIQSISDYDYEVRDYDFTTGTTDLSDWETDTTRSAYFSDFQISSTPVSGSAYALIQHTSTADRFLFIKDIMRQEVKVEAWISNYRGVTSGTSDRGDLGVVIHADPVMDYDFRYNADSGNSVDRTNPFARTSFVVDADSNRYNLRQRAVTNDVDYSLTTAGISLDGLKKYTLDCRKGFIKGYINDVLVSDTIMQSGGYYGRVGVTCYTQNSFTCLRYKVYYPAQQVTLDRPVTANAGDLVYETGAEFTHKTGNLVIKQASMIEDPLGHGNLAYCYRGASNYEGDAVFPYVYNVFLNDINSNARNTSTGFYNLINNQTVYDLNSYLFTSTTTATGSMIIDLGAERTFTHVTFQEYFRTQTQYFASNGHISIRTSNDLTNWTVALAPYNDTRRRSFGDALRIYELDSPQTARYVQFIRAGVNNESTVENRWSSLGVRNYTDGYKLKLNNVSDFDVNDRVIIAYDGGYNTSLPETLYYTTLMAGTTPSGSWLNELKDYYTIVSKDAVNKTITLDRPFTHSFISKGNRIFKANKPIRVSGEIGTNTWKCGRFVIEVGYNLGRHNKILNTEFTHLSAYYPTNLNGSYSYGNWVTRNGTVDRSDDFDGISIHTGNANATSYGAIFNYSGGSILIRDNLLVNWNGRGWYTYGPNYLGTLYMVGNTILMSNMIESLLLTGYTDMYVNYNSWISNQSSYGAVFTLYNATLRFVKTFDCQIKRNYFNGGTSSGLRIYQGHGYGERHRFDIDSNMFEYMDDNSVSNLHYLQAPIKNIVLPKKGNTNNRLSRFNQAGHTGTNWVANHIIQNHYTNYNNWGYDLSHNFYSYYIKYPNESYYRVYKLSNSTAFAIFGTTFSIEDDNVTGSFDLSFRYFHSLDQASLTGNTYTGSLSLLTLKDGKAIDTIVFPKPTEFTNASATVNFSGSGMYTIGLMQSAYNGYVAFDNIYNKLSSTNQNSLKVYTNTFDLRQAKSAYPRDYAQFQGFTKNVNADNTLRLNGLRLK